MDYQQLLFASHVHSLAQEIRSSELQQHLNSLDESEDRKKIRAEWLLANPNKNYVAQALAKIHDVAKQINQLS